MLKVNKSLFFLSIIIAALQGCSSVSPSLYSDAGDAFSKGYNSASKAISDTSDRAPMIDRTILLEKDYIQNSIIKNKISLELASNDLASYICAGQNALADEKTSLTVLSAYQAHIKDLTTAPSNNVGDVWESIKKNSKPQSPLELKPITKNDHCLNEVKYLSRLSAADIGQVPEAAIAAILPLYDTISKLIDAIKESTANILAVADDAVRAKALQSYIEKNKILINDILDRRLTHVDSVIQALCVKDPSYYACDEFKKQPPTVLDGTLIRAKWASLRLPLYIFYDLDKNSNELADKGKYAEILMLAKNANDGINQYLDLKNQRRPSNIVTAMKDAENNLESLASGKMSPKDSLTALKAFSKQLSAIKDSINKTHEAFTAVGP